VADVAPGEVGDWLGCDMPDLPLELSGDLDWCNDQLSPFCTTDADAASVLLADGWDTLLGGL
jgi:hypothetical protein